MAKLVILIVALAFQAVFALNEVEQRNHEVQELLKQVQTVSTDASKIIQDVEIADHQHIHSLYSQANEFAHSIHDVVYHLQQVVSHNEEGKGEEALQQILSKLSQLVHDIEQSMHLEPNQLKMQLKNEIQRVATEAKNLAQVAQQEQSTEEVNDEIENALDDLLVANEQLQARNKLQHKTKEEIKTFLHESYDDAIKTIENLKIDNEDDSERFIQYSYHLAHHVAQITYKLLRNADDYEGEVVKTFEQVINKLREIRTALEKIGSDKETQTEELKEQLKTHLHDIALQIEKFVDIAQSKDIKEKETVHLRDLVESVLARSIVAAKQLKRHAETVVEKHEEY